MKSLTFHPARSNELQIDLDRPGAALPPAVFEWINSLVGIRSAVMAESRNGNTHWIVTLKRRLPLLDRILLAAALGDDPVRVMHNYSRARRHSPRPVLFFEKEK